MFRGAVRADMAKILEVYARARDFMAKNGNPTQWGDNYPSPELLEEDIDTNRLFVYMVNGKLGLYPLRHHPCRGRHPAHCLPAAVSDPEPAGVSGKIILILWF